MRVPGPARAGPGKGKTVTAKIGSFEENAGEYDGWFAGNRFAYESELRAVGMLLPRSGAGVEIGVGTGRFAGRLGIRLGVEPSKSMRAIARDRGITVVGGTAEALPFRDGRFDFAAMVTVLCFFDDPDAALLESYRVLKPSGSLVIAIYRPGQPPGEEVRRAENRKRLLPAGDVLFGRRSCRDAEASGFPDARFPPDDLRRAGRDGRHGSGAGRVRRRVLRRRPGGQVG